MSTMTRRIVSDLIYVYFTLTNVWIYTQISEIVVEEWKNRRLLNIINPIPNVKYSLEISSFVACAKSEKNVQFLN